MVWFSDVQREEAIEICQLLISASRTDLVVPALRQGWKLDDARQQLAAVETAPAPVAKAQEGTLPSSAHSGHLADEVEQVAAARFAAQRGRH